MYNRPDGSHVDYGGSKIMELAQRAAYFQKWGLLKHNGSHHLCIMINTDVLSRFSEGHSATQHQCLYDNLKNCPGVP